MATENLSGQVFGRLTVLDDYYKKPRNPHGYRIYWHCKCQCGNECYVNVDGLKRGKTSSCGCYRKENTSKMRKTHGLADTRLYCVWRTMKQRCLCVTDESYPGYGGRGITVCNEWLDYQKFYEWAMANGYDEKADRGTYTIERIDVNGNYEPSNCCLTPQHRQAWNRRNSIRFTLNGEEKALGEWCEIFNIPYRKVYARIKRLHWSVEDALTT